MNVPPNKDRSYNAAAVQEEVAALWDRADAFHADPAAPGEPYSIVIPPPNVTAALHMGHALNNTLQDILTRYHRMRGDNTLWMPGTDHAGISTQHIVEKRVMLQEGKRRTDFTREQFVEKIQAWKDEYEARITHQLKEMGCSCDWKRQRFTMDPVCAAAVREAFFQLFRAGLIYRGKRLVNWDPVTQTALADDEVEMREIDGHFWYMRYPIVDDAGKPIGDYATVATTRPETMLGDTAVAVNPHDPINAKWIGRKCRLPIVNRIIPIIGDEYVVMPDPNSDDAKAKYASGFLKVTPAHDPNDWEIGQRHGLPVINVMAPDATISREHGWREDLAGADAFLQTLFGLDRYAARKAIVEWFKQQDLLADVKPYTHSVGHSYRSHVPIEPYLSDQWYVKVTDDRLAGAALRAMAEDQRSESTGCVWKGGGSFDLAPGDSPGAKCDGALRFYPARYAKTFQSWHENIRDWCISRQLWWGHRIPVWSAAHWIGGDDSAQQSARFERFADDGRLSWVGPPIARERHVCVRYEDDAEVIDFLTSEGFQQDPDVLDTWFSSALWPISTMGWPTPEQFPEAFPEGDAVLKKWNPTNTLCTAREIITLWVSRMVMFNLFFRNCLPFRDVFIHAMIQDGEGQKMSKSLGNGVDPLDIIHSHGADAMRFTLAAMTTQTQDVRMPVDLVCPHTGATFTPKMITTSAGYRVMAPVQQCPTDPAKKMVTTYGMTTGEATPTDDMPLARNTSSKFDEGRNFTNKLWNVVTGFALPALAGQANAAPASTVPGGLADRWILSRLARTIQSADAALRAYEFKPYADAMYDFIWRDFCDWYVEAIKPVVRQDSASGSAARATAAACIDAMLRVLHPVMPFVTEKLFCLLNEACPRRGVAGVELPPGELCVTAAWPSVDPALIDDSIERQFDLINQVVKAIRTVRNQYKVPPRQPVRVRMKASGEAADTLTANRAMIETLCTCACDDAAIGPDVQRPTDAATAMVGEIELYIESVVDTAAEVERLTRRRDELIKSKTALEGRLNNKGYVDRAPAHLVQQSRDQLAELLRELEAVESGLSRLEASRP